MLSFNLSSIFSIMLSYYLGRLDSIWVIISTSSMITPNFPKSPLNNYSSVIKSFGSLVTPSNSFFANLLRSVVLDDTIIGWNFLFNPSDARKLHPLGNSPVTDFSMIWKHTVSYCAKPRSLYTLLFSCFIWRLIKSSLLCCLPGFSQWTLWWYRSQFVLTFLSEKKTVVLQLLGASSSS